MFYDTIMASKPLDMYEKSLDVDEFGANEVRGIKAFRKVLEGHVERYLRNCDGEEVLPQEIFRDPDFPFNGFLPGILPDYVRNITADVGLDGTKIVTLGQGCLYDSIKISYDGNLDHRRASEFWRKKGYHAKPLRKSLLIARPDDGGGIEEIAIYGKNVLKIFHHHLLERDLSDVCSLDEFLKHFEPLNPGLDLQRRR